MPEALLKAYESFAQTLAMLTDTSSQNVLDGVCAALCAGKTWADVRARNPLNATTALYAFVVEEPEILYDEDEEDAEGKLIPSSGYFDESQACTALIEELDEQWQGYDNFTKAHKRQARIWVEKALAAQPGFLEAGLALASMQHDAGETEAAATLDRFIKQAEALIPDGFNGPIPWAQIGNRFFHRMLWLRMRLHYESDDFKGAVRLARKQLKLNPGDNVGLRFVLPLLLLQQGDFVAAKRATKGLQGENGLGAGTIRAFCEFAVGNKDGFRRELAEALISLPWLRVFLMNQRAPLPDGDDGFRGIHPDLELFTEFVWPAYVEVPGLVFACRSFLSEARVLEAEARLRKYWKAFGGRGENRVGSFAEWLALCREALDAIGKPMRLRV
jgi:tetratricopeptide (TPR) repeat protein